MLRRNKENLDILAENVRFSGIVENGFCWDELTRERMRNPKSLEPYGYKVYSQNDEDGIINEIFKRIGTTNKTFIEFGVQDGLESNCHLLLYYGWHGLWIEGSENYCKEIQIKFRPVIENGQLTVKNAFITRDNINDLFESEGFIGEIDLLSVDIDGNDLYVWDAIDIVNPRVVITEYNGKFPPDLEWCQAYNPTHIWNGTDWHGASLKAFELLGKRKGYQLVGTDLRGCNAFFVRNDLVKDMFYESATAEALYNPLRLGLEFVANHPAKYCLAVQKENLGVLNYQSYELAEGFHKEEIVGDKKHVWTSDKCSILRILVKAGTNTIEIPYSFPCELIQDAHYEVYVEAKEINRTKCALTGSGGQCILQLKNKAEVDFVCDIVFEIPVLWSPSDIMNSEDTRKLGIDLVLSDIKMY